VGVSSTKMGGTFGVGVGVHVGVEVLVGVRVGDAVGVLVGTNVGVAVGVGETKTNSRGAGSGICGNGGCPGGKVG
jgi:hypothetical protein